MVVTAAVAPGEPLPAVAMRYLGVWALARKEGAMPAFPQFALEILRDAFANLSVVGLEQIVDQCNASYLLQELDAAGPEGNRADLLKKSAYNRKSAQLLVIGEKLLVNELTEAWRSLPAVLTFKRSLKEKARRTLQRAANAIEDKGHHNRVEFIGVLAMPGARNSSSFFSQALAMMRFRLTGLGAPLFVIVCGADDGSWCSANIPGGADVLHASPRADSPLGMALLAACNHSVFAFGANGVGAALRTRDGSNFVYHFGGSLTERRDMLRFVQRVKPPWFQLEF
ncbi:Hypothetical predicted protein [Cloeon dipterum]|uniref:Uncharacterized protein n=1 Tax=Cloeon dipterum TaxID=197152 RepID=A0A8S1DNP1_9INSE|nr:Hypothetical predicted protein [Cloeon dipterum]